MAINRLVTGLLAGSLLGAPISATAQDEPTQSVAYQELSTTEKIQELYLFLVLYSNLQNEPEDFDYLLEEGTAMIFNAMGHPVFLDPNIDYLSYRECVVFSGDDSTYTSEETVGSIAAEFLPINPGNLVALIELGWINGDRTEHYLVSGNGSLIYSAQHDHSKEKEISSLNGPGNLPQAVDDLYTIVSGTQEFGQLHPSIIELRNNIGQ